MTYKEFSYESEIIITFPCQLNAQQTAGAHQEQQSLEQQQDTTIPITPEVCYQAAYSWFSTYPIMTLQPDAKGRTLRGDVVKINNALTHTRFHPQTKHPRLISLAFETK